MPCFSSKTPPPSLQDYEVYKSIGFIGTYDQYLRHKQKAYDPDAVFFICGTLEGLEYCNHTNCIGVNEFLCDYPIGDDKTCDYGMCREHSNIIGEDLHYCKAHYDLWMQTKPKDLHVEEIGYLVDQVFYPIKDAWIARNKANFLNQSMIRVFGEEKYFK